MLAKLATPTAKTPVSSQEPPKTLQAKRPSRAAYQIVTPLARERGRWYFEVTLKTNQISQFSPTALWFGCGEFKTNTSVGGLAHIRPVDVKGMKWADTHIGAALDLEEGMFYTRRDGEWGKGVPGSIYGLAAKLGRPYRCAVDTTALIGPMIDKGMIDVNFGDRPFVYALPDGYRPFIDR